MRRIIISVILLTCSLIAFCGEFKEDGLYAVIHTSMGKMGFRLYYERVPVTVGNFVGLAEGTIEFTNMKSGKKEKRPFYNELIFHRVVKGFVIQAGCPLENGMGNPGYSFVDEFDPGLNHNSRGILSMANSGPNTNGSQFFITLKPASNLNNRHSVFGKMVYGEDVLTEIGNVKTDNQNKPIEDVFIKSIRIVKIGKDAKAFDAEKAFAQNKELLKNYKEKQDKWLKSLLSKLGVKEDRIVSNESGLRYYVKRRGKGRKPSVGDIIKAHYSGYLIYGKKFDSSYDRNQPFETPIGVRRVIQGWDEAFLDMRKGEKRVLIIPHHLAYGRRGMPPFIPPGATLVFEVELLSIKKGN
ncbi:MAG: peptidylprolyl isomerase [Spirochaetota bacterium]|nr:peptidylprolyl isomerase [Spirochaetota bacterium]